LLVIEVFPGKAGKNSKGLIDKILFAKAFAFTPVFSFTCHVLKISLKIRIKWRFIKSLLEQKKKVREGRYLSQILKVLIGDYSKRLIEPKLSGYAQSI
jgi:hypothetical protein